MDNAQRDDVKEKLAKRVQGFNERDKMFFLTNALWDAYDALGALTKPTVLIDHGICDNEEDAIEITEFAKLMKEAQKK